eukprot:1818477-Prymnesium_polylepis.1
MSVKWTVVLLEKETVCLLPIIIRYHHPALLLGATIAPLCAQAEAATVCCVRCWAWLTQEGSRKFCILRGSVGIDGGHVPPAGSAPPPTPRHAAPPGAASPPAPSALARPVPVPSSLSSASSAHNA